MRKMKGHTSANKAAKVKFAMQAFLTAVMQTYARQHKLPLDVMKFRTDVTTKSVEQITEAAPVGCYIHGKIDTS